MRPTYGPEKPGSDGVQWGKYENFRPCLQDLYQANIEADRVMRYGLD